MSPLATVLITVATLLLPLSTATTVEVVLAHCKEDLAWVNEMGYGDITTVYDKCGNSDGPGKHITKPNVGREGGTYLQHIVDRYDSLADWTVFSQGERPTYGYRGHRLGGGHMMSNVRFQDYVEAAANGNENPRFFISTTILSMADGTIFQCIREGYGAEYTKPEGDPASGMCGALDIWHAWFEFPDWFKDMVMKLQREQRAPFLGFDAEKLFQLFEIQPAQGLLFFPQGARFAVSRDAIQSRPKSYYEKLLPFMNHPDPWAGYFLEWLWWYVLGGSSAPCGYELPVMYGHKLWKSGMGIKDRSQMITQQTSGGGTGGVVSNITDNTTSFDRDATVTTSDPITAPVFTVQENVTVTFAAPATIQSTTFICEPGSTLVFTDTATITVTIFQVASGGTIEFSSTTVITGAVVLTRGSTMTFGSTSTMSGNTTVGEGATVVFKGNSNIAGSLNVGTGSVVTFSEAATITAQLVVSSANITVESGKTVEIASTVAAAMTGTRIRGSGRFNHRGRGRRHRYTVCRFEITFFISVTASVSSANRRTDLTNYDQIALCGTDASATTLNSGTALVIDLSCTSATDSRYSNTISSLTSPTGSIIYMTGFTATSLPTLITSWSGVSTAQLEGTVTQGGTYCSTALLYTNPGTCTTSWTSSIDGCGSSFSCKFVGSTYSNAQYCQVQMCVSSNPSSNNDALLGLIALVAIVPIAGIIAILWWHFKTPAEPAADFSAPVEVADVKEYQTGVWSPANTPVGAMGPYPSPVGYQPGFFPGYATTYYA